MAGVSHTGLLGYLQDELPEYMFGHPKLVLNMLRVATKEFPDPHLPTENGGVIGLFEKGLPCIPGCSSIGCYGHHKGSSPPPGICFLFCKESGNVRVGKRKSWGSDLLDLGLGLRAARCSRMRRAWTGIFRG